MKTLKYLIVIVIVLVLGFYALNSYIYNEKQRNVKPKMAEYFGEQMVQKGIDDIGMPIEGFDPNLFTMAYPGLVPQDFNGVQALEGSYTVTGEEIIFNRNGDMPVSSAERTISKEGYSTLLQNLSLRLDIPVESERDVNRIINTIDTGERVEAKIGQGASVFGVKITPLSVVEDSRCPANANCIQAGTVRINTTLESGMGSAPQVFELNKPITTEAEEVTLIQVLPYTEAGKTIVLEDYQFVFQVKKR